MTHVVVLVNIEYSNGAFFCVRMYCNTSFISFNFQGLFLDVFFGNSTQLELAVFEFFGNLSLSSNRDFV